MANDKIKIIGGSGIIEMKYNYISNALEKFNKGQEYMYSKIILDGSIKGRKCSGITNTFYIVNNTRIPTTRAIKKKINNYGK